MNVSRALAAANNSLFAVPGHDRKLCEAVFCPVRQPLTLARVEGGHEGWCGGRFGGWSKKEVARCDIQETNNISGNVDT